jgi:hypothetical protein
MPLTIEVHADPIADAIYSCEMGLEEIIYHLCAKCEDQGELADLIGSSGRDDPLNDLPEVLWRVYEDMRREGDAPRPPRASAPDQTRVVQRLEARVHAMETTAHFAVDALADQMELLRQVGAFNVSDRLRTIIGRLAREVPVNPNEPATSWLAMARSWE